MNNHVTYDEVKNILEKNRLPYQSMSIGEGCEILIAERGARVFGPFIGGGESILWLNKAFKDAQAFKKLIDKKYWNLGGDRLWIAPEFAFFCKERLRFDDTYIVQNAMDPGNYHFVPTENGLMLEQEVEADVYEMPFANKKMKMSKQIWPAENPLTGLSEAEDLHVQYCGYTQKASLIDCSPEHQMDLEPWFLSQINPGGKLIVPFGGDFSFVDYYNPVDSSIQQVGDDYVVLNINGQRKYKVAYPAAKTFGRAAYINQLADGRYYALFRNYYNEPSNAYACAPWHSPHKRGCSLYVYNDDGGAGGFGEFENSGLTINSDAGETDISAEVTQWLFIGDKSDIERIIYTLIGISYTI